MPGAKIAADSITTAQIGAAAVNTSELVDASVTTAKLADGAVTAAKIATDSITATQVAPGAIGASELGSAAVTYAKIQDVSVTDRLLGRSSAGAGTVEEIPLTAAGRALLDDADNTAQRATLGLGTIAVTSTITSTELADDAVTAAKLANNSSVDLITTLPGSGAFVGQIALDTDDSKAYIWNGATWTSFKAAGSVNTAIGGTSGVVNVTVATSGDQITIDATFDNTDGAAQFVAGPTGNTGAVSYRQIVGTDLPAATAVTKGAAIVDGEGLRMNSDNIEIDNDIVASATHHVVTYDDKGLITAGRSIAAGDLPSATPSAKGGVIIGTGLSVDGTGLVNHTNNVTAGTATKITFDNQGHVTGTLNLDAADVPVLDTAKITTGTFATARIAASAITGPKLADYSSAKIANSAPAAEYIGQLFFNPLERTLFMWDGNVYQPIGVSFGQIIFGGTYNASTNLISSVTTDGAAIGLAVGASLVSPTAATRAHYVVVDVGGTGTAPAPAVALLPPDIILSTGSNWVLLDVSDTVVAQLASNVQVTPAGNIASTNVQAALQELDTEKLPITGGTMTGVLEIGNTGSLAFEGSTANAFETTLGVVDPTADRTVLLPDLGGTVALTSQLNDGTF